jgi:hypothetical protein
MQDRTHKPGAPISLELMREERERREARDRVLACEVGIQIGRRREREKMYREREKAWGRGFIVGIIVTLVFLLCGFIGAQKVNAATHADIKGSHTNGQTIKVRIGTRDASSWALYRLGEKTMPPGWRTFLRICQLEQPGDEWRGVWWSNTANYSFLGGCGLTLQNFRDVRHPAWPATADRLNPRDQLWASFFLFWKHARIGQDMRGSYDGGQRYGSTVWDVHTHPGLNFDGFSADGRTPA